MTETGMGGISRENPLEQVARLLETAEQPPAEGGEWVPADGRGAAGPIPVALEEAEELLAALCGTVTDAGQRDALYGMSLAAAAIRCTLGPAGYRLGRLRERFATLCTLAADQCGDDGPEPELLAKVDLTCEWAFRVAERWSRTLPGAAREADADLTVSLLGGLLDGPDGHLVAEPTRCRAVLGLVLSDRSRRAEHRSPERLADRRNALALLDAARTADDLDPLLWPDVTFDFVQLSALELDDRVGTGPSPSAAAAGAEEAIVLLDLTLALLDGGTSADPAELGVLLCDLLLELSTAQRHQGRAVDWFRAVLARPGLPDGTRIELKRGLVHALCLRSEENRHAQRPGDPVPAQDRAAAVELLEEVLAAHPAMPPADRSGPGERAAGTAEDPTTHGAPVDDEFVAYFDSLVQLLWLDLSEGVLGDRGHDRLAVCVRQLVPLIGPEDDDRAAAVLKAAIVLGQRAVRRGLPLAHGLADQAVLNGRQNPSMALEHTAPHVVADVREAVDLLRTGTGLYPHDDELHLYAQGFLGVALLLDFACRLPVAEPAVLREGLRCMRVAMERLPERDGLGDADFRGAFLIALMYRVWYTEPFLRAWTDRNGPGVPDVSGFPTVEDDVQLLDAVLGASDEEEEPLLAFLFVMVRLLRSPGVPPSVADSRAWSERLRRAVPRLGAEATGLRVIMLGVAGVLGLRLEEEGKATGVERQAARTALREALSLLPQESPLRPPVVAALDRLGTGDVRRLLGLFLGVSTRAEPDGAGREPAEDARGARGAPPAPDGRPPTGDSPVAAVLPGPQSRTPAHVDGSPGPPSGPAAPRTAPVLDLDAAVLLGDGTPDPFAVPATRVAELVGTDEPMSAPATATLAVLHHHRWLRDRDGQDLETAVALARSAVAAVGRAHTPVSAKSALADRCSEFLARLLLDRHLILGDRTDLDAAARVYGALLERTSEDVVLPPLCALLAASGDPRVPARLFRPVPSQWTAPFRAELLAVVWAGPAAHAALSGSASAAEDAANALHLLPEGHPRRPALRGELIRRELEQAVAMGDLAAARAAAGELLDVATSCPEEGMQRPSLLLRAAATLCDLYRAEGAHGADTGHPRHEHDHAVDALLDRTVTVLGAETEQGSHGYHGSRSRCAYGLGVLLLTRYGRGGDAADLRRALRVLRDRWAVLHTAPGDPLARAVLRALAEAHRAHGPADAGHRRDSRDTARSLLNAHGRAVLLQSGTGHALEVARAVASDMLRLVRWSLEDGEPRTAYEALELGRGLVLNAATVSVTVPELLRDGGHSDLARHWEDAAGGGGRHVVPDGLRRQVLEAFAGSAAERRLVSAPNPGQVGQALRRLARDALVYLVPGEYAEAGGGTGGTTATGHAVVVGATGVVEALALPGLVVSTDGPLGAYDRAADAFRSTARADDRPAPGDPEVMHAHHERRLARLERKWRDALDALCSWAGEVAMGPVLSASRSRLGRTPRLVLAPVGALGAVPWHAARCSDGPTGAAYACQRALLQYCATARQLMEVADRPRTRLGAGPVAVVADPQGSWRMHREAALVGSMYEGTRVVGGLGGHAPADAPPPLPPVPESLRALLPGRSRVPAALLHVNCHADTGRSPADSVLRLGTGHRITVADVLAGAADRDPGTPGGIVVLANCTSDLTVSDHDEALTLATAFLGAGATAVVGSRWDVADDPRTTALMLVLHHRLRAGDPAGEALRAAQLWMLDPHRTVPGELEAYADVFREADRRGLDELEVWSAFAHHGQ
ncbi:CHAT domain-containing protein [Streptomyces sp. MUM 2J]|uniref:CHAT domain-containing protein n=1 Tax=Streptomyces sp. MUM 2J TaxID=2791987 RepID=UPI001F03535F|nr:CHAT domain-containing protein [Streptomyces sp. MUM 2J]MCH0565771.1 CHAT domain-containing protein [Streptomyces sp. MUM 2J]